MGMHKWLLGPFICLILGVASARPPECQEAPLWSVGGRQPLTEAKGKASMLEAMLAHFHTYGMTDLRFIIVNSKIWHAKATLYELQDRVSFEVYQETDEEEVWSVMGGGKDDMYVYDRCGRLTYYIPFPLSIMHEQQNIVSTAVLATYFRSPCGVTCEKNSSLALEEFIEEIEQSENSTNTIMENNDVLSITDASPLQEASLPENSTSSTAEEFNSTDSNDILPTIEDNNDYEFLSNNIEVNNLTDADYLIHNDTTEHDATNETSMRKAHDFFNHIVNLFFSEEEFENVSGFKYNRTVGNDSSTPTSETAFNTEPNLHNETNPLHSHQKYGHSSVVKGRPQPKNQKKTDRCAEADSDVCKDWSKKRLLHAQKCCSSSSRASSLQMQEQRTCRNFGKRRCKKIQSLLKCCLKTAIADATTTTEAPSTTEAITTVDTRIVCCKRVQNGKLCRVADAPPCEEDEYIADSTNLTL